MSRSYRKTPIMGHTKCRSENFDKISWHKRWRTQERLKLSSLNNLDNHITIDRREVSNPWSMGKDGKQYFSLRKQTITAKEIANKYGKSSQERSAIKIRLLRQWMGK
jgi:hypothetical protein